MDFKHYTDLSVDLAVDLVNTFGDGAGTLEELHRMLGPSTQSLSRLKQADIPEIRRLAARLRQVFTAADVAAGAAILNALLDEIDALPQLVDHDREGHHLHFAPADASPLRLLAATTGMGLAVVLAEHGMDRLGVCDAESCADVYVDTSRNRSRRYCSLTCSNRANVAAHRARQRAARSG
jgi:predicted RNA-binding Zn ribbon-like protein